MKNPKDGISIWEFPQDFHGLYPHLFAGKGKAFTQPVIRFLF
jgi:hypothetical protein